MFCFLRSSVGKDLISCIVSSLRIMFRWKAVGIYNWFKSVTVGFDTGKWIFEKPYASGD